MKKCRISQLATGALLIPAVFLWSGWADTWEALKDGMGTVSSVRAEFVQEKHMQILAKPLVSGGTFQFQAPDSLRWAYEHPVYSIMIMHQGKTRRYIKRDGALIEDAGAKQPTIRHVFEDIIRWLGGRFDENPAFAAQLVPGGRIVLTPRDPSLARFIQRIELDLARRPGVIEAVRIYESEDTFTILSFKNVVLNQPLPETLFRPETLSRKVS